MISLARGEPLRVGSRARARSRSMSWRILACLRGMPVAYRRVQGLRSKQRFGDDACLRIGDQDSNPCVRQDSIKAENFASSASTSARTDRSASFFASSRV
jgi:hypothetical protein